MKPILLPLVACLLTASGCTDRGAESAPQAQQDIILPVDFSRVSIRDGFWSPRLEKLSDSTLPVCIDQIENRTGRIRNFENAAKGSGKHSGIFFDDSDVYKALEGISYSLINNPDPMLRRTADQWVAKIAAAQQPDGYINTYYTLTGLDKRWTDMDKHEMYCAGHMIEAGIAYLLATGDRTLLEVSTRMVGHMMNEFGPGKRHWVPGHEEIELALAKLYSVTGEPKYLEFARWLLEERGHGYGRNEEGTWNAAYYQDSIPVSRMTDITGHAVRCMYLFCGMADMSMLSGDTVYRAALDRVWDDVVQRNMYITGGIGSSHQNEGFTEDYDLPNLEAYCETCASVGMVLWNARMNRLKGDAEYADVQRGISGYLTRRQAFFLCKPARIERRPPQQSLVRLRLLSQPTLTLFAVDRQLYLQPFTRLRHGLGEPLPRQQRRYPDPGRQPVRTDPNNPLSVGRQRQDNRQRSSGQNQERVAAPDSGMVQEPYAVGKRRVVRPSDG